MGNIAHPALSHRPRVLPGSGIFLTPDSGPGPLPFGPFAGFSTGVCGPLATPFKPAKAGGSLVIFGISLPFGETGLSGQGTQPKASESAITGAGPSGPFSGCSPDKGWKDRPFRRSGDAILWPSSSCAVHSFNSADMLPNSAPWHNRDATGRPRPTTLAPLH
jgi:hypothetical protein